MRGVREERLNEEKGIKVNNKNEIKNERGKKEEEEEKETQKPPYRKKHNHIKTTTRR